MKSFQHISDVAKQAIQISDRMGAVLVTLMVGEFTLPLILHSQMVSIKRLGYIVLVLLIILAV